MACRRGRLLYISVQSSSYHGKIVSIAKPID
jgi:hypothetical protein